MNREKLLYFTIIVIAVVICSIGYSNYLEKSSSMNNKNIKTESISEEKQEQEIHAGKKKQAETVTVYIVGEVNEPDIYTLPKGCRVADVLKAAGGATDNADISKINLARILNDEDKIDVPSFDDNIAAEEKDDNKSDDVKIVNINTASKDELKMIPYIGDVTADKIIYYREKHGGFKQKAELKNVPRIGDKLYNEIEKYICRN